MHKSCILFIIYLFLPISSLIAQDFKFDLDNPIIIDPDEIGHICTLDPTDVNAHYYISSDRIRQKLPFSQSTSEFQVIYQNDCGGQTWPQEAQDALEFAAGIWEEHISSSIPIRIEANWVELPENVLGSAGATSFFTLTNAGMPNTAYTIAQASALIDMDIVESESGLDADIIVNINCDFNNWYFGTDANTPGGLIDFVTVALHEIGHGIGFLGIVNANNNTMRASSGFNNGQIPYIYEVFAVDGFFNNLTDPDLFPHNSRAKYDFVTGRNSGVFFDGAEAELANDADDNVRIYAPSQFQQGSSFSHLDQTTFSNTENALMRPRIDMAFAIHNPGPVFCGVLDDMGWPLGPACTAQLMDEAFPRKPDLASPLNNEIDMPEENITYTWTPVNNAVEYQLQISDDFTFSDTQFNETLEGTEATPNLTYEKSTTYYWRARGLDNDGNGAWSNTWSFTIVEDVPDPVVLLSPDEGAVNVEPGNFAFSWEPAARAELYNIQVSENPDFSEHTIDSPVSGVSYSLTSNLEFLTLYYWRVRGVNDQGEGEWSETRSFTTIIERPEMVTLNSPENNGNQISTTPQLSWDEADRASEYTVQLSLNSDFSDPVIDTEVSETSFIVGETLENATIYYWRVRASNIGGDGDWSETWSFATEVFETLVFNNYPNPFNPSTTIRYQLSEQTRVLLDVYDVIGRRVKTLVNEEQDAGVYFVTMDASDMASGVYLLRFVANNVNDVQKMTLMK